MAMSLEAFPGDQYTNGPVTAVRIPGEKWRPRYQSLQVKHDFETLAEAAQHLSPMDLESGIDASMAMMLIDAFNIKQANQREEKLVHAQLQAQDVEVSAPEPQVERRLLRLRTLSHLLSLRG